MVNRINKVADFRILLFFFIVILSIPAFHFFTGQLFYLRSQIFFEEKAYYRAAEMLQQGARWLPFDSRIQQKLGELYLLTAMSVKGNFRRVMLIDAMQHFHKAEQLNPLEPEFALSSAAALAILEQKNPDRILAAYRRAIELWPNNPLYHRILAEELDRFGRRDELEIVIRTLGRIYPGSYKKIQSRPYWSAAIQRVFREGLLLALEQGTDLRKARIALADISAQQHDWAAAVAQYRLAMTLEKHSNGAGDYFQLGAYYLHNNDLEAANQAFITGASLEQVEVAYLNRLVSVFSQADHLAALPRLYLLLSAKLAFSYVEDIQLAEVLIRNNQDEFAQELLDGVIAEREYLAKPWFLQAEIYRRQGDIAAMKLALRKGNARK